MKKICILALVFAAVLCLFSCNEAKGEPVVTTGKVTDWRNTIEYEGSFFVNKDRKMLYALDMGKITLWDNEGSGAPFQELKYDTSVADAIESIEKEDFNADGN